MCSALLHTIVHSLSAIITRLVSLSSGLLFRNSIHILSASLIKVALGFFFWVLCARVYAKDDIGIAVVLISMASLVLLSSRFGLDFSLIRFLPELNRSTVYSTSVLVTSSSAALIGLLIVALTPFLYPDVHLSNDVIFVTMFVLFCVVLSWDSIMGNMFLAIRKAFLYSIMSAILGVRLALLFPMERFAEFGPFLAVGFSSAIALVFGIISLSRNDVHFRSRIDVGYLRRSFRYSVGNYLTTLFLTAPPLVLNMIVLSALDAESSADFYIAYMIASVLFFVPGAFSTSLFVEGSHGVDLRNSARVAALSSFAMLAPAVLALLFLAPFILGIFGEGYVAAGGLLRILSVSSVPLTIVYIYFSIERVRGRVKILAAASLCLLASVVGLSSVLIREIGLIGVGCAWLLSYSVFAAWIVIVFAMRRHNL
jgi:O-antigen/teichoic acid export membrane protein